MNVLWISIDSSILERGSESYNRHKRYSERFEQFTVLAKSSDIDAHIIEQELEVISVDGSSRLKFLFNAYRKAARRCKNGGVDVIAVQSPFATEVVGLILKLRYNIPLHVSVVIDFPNEAWRSESLKHRMYNPIINHTLKNADSIRVDTKSGKWKIQQLLNIDVPISVVPVHIDVNNFNQTVSLSKQKEIERELDVSNQSVILFVGRFVYQKNMTHWLSVAEEIISRMESPPIFVLLGDGPGRNKIKRNVTERGIEHYFRCPGWVDGNEIGAYYDVADLFMITSRYEGACRVVIEASLKKLPVIATPFAGALDNIKHDHTGYVEHTTEALATKAVDLLENPEKNRRFGQEAYNLHHERTDMVNLVDKYENSIRDAV